MGKPQKQGTTRKRKAQEATLVNNPPKSMDQNDVEGTSTEDQSNHCQDQDVQMAEQYQVPPSAIHLIACKLQTVDKVKIIIAQPVLLANPNHASLLNIMESMDAFGNPGDQWEGSAKKQIQYTKPYFHGVCIVEGGQVEAAFKRYYRSRFSSIFGERLTEASKLRTDYEPEEREHFLHQKFYSSIDNVRALIKDSKEVVCVLYQQFGEGNGQQVVCVLINKGKKGMVIA